MEKPSGKLYYVRYSHVIPNTQCFESLYNILVHYGYTPKEVTKDYLLVGFRNTLERGWNLVWDDTNTRPKPFYFISVENIIGHLETQVNFNIDDFVETINNTIVNGYDLEEIKEKRKIKIKMERKKVYKRIDTERLYQDLQWSTRRTLDGTPDDQKPPAEWINYIEHHISAAKKGVYELDTEEALAQVRKVAALAVRCLELHGCPKREIPEELLNEG